MQNIKRLLDDAVYMEVHSPCLVVSHSMALTRSDAYLYHFAYRLGVPKRSSDVINHVTKEEAERSVLYPVRVFLLNEIEPV